MKHRLIALLGLLSPLILLLSCLLLVAISGLAGWFLYSQRDSQAGIRILSVAPLQTPPATGSTTTSLEPDQPPATSPDSLPPPTPEAEQQPAPAQVAVPTASSPDRAPAPELPAGSVNALNPSQAASRLVIPRLELDAPVMVAPIENQSWKVDHLGQAIGHLEGTAVPGSNSNVVLAGHVTLAAGVYGPFAGLAMLEPGDFVFLHQAGQRFKYVIDGYETVPRTAIEVTYPTQSGQITLITCSSWDNEAGRYLERVVVKGHLVDG